MITIEQAREHVGDGVVYKAGTSEVEQGVITSVNETTVFVRYLGDMGSKGTFPEDLTPLNPLPWSFQRKDQS